MSTNSQDNVELHGLEHPSPSMHERAQVSLNSKIIFSFLLVNLVAIAAIALAVNYTSSQALSEQAGADLHNLANSEGLAVGDLLQHQVDLLETLSVNEIITSRTSLSNSRYVGDDVTIAATLLEQDSEWKSISETDLAAQIVMTNSSAKELAAFRRRFPNHSQISITDQHGATLASTHLTQDFYRADETWWLATFADGVGRTYIGSQSVGEVGLPSVIIAVPILAPDGSETIGVLRATYDMSQLYNQVAAAAQPDGHLTVALLLPDSGLIITPHENTFDQNPDIVLALSKLDDHVITDLQSSIFQQVSLDDVPFLASMAAVDTIGGSEMVTSLRWSLLATQERDFALASVSLQQRTIWLLAIFIMIAATFSAVLTANRLTTPIVNLTEAAQKIRDGQLEIEADVVSNDEIGVLAYTFNGMTSQLRRSIAELSYHRDQLEARVAERTAELARQSKMWDVVLSTTPNYYFIFDNDGRIIYANPAAQSAMNVSANDVLGQAWQALPLVLPAHFPQELDRVFSSGAPLKGEFSMVIEAQSRAFEYTLNAVLDENESVTSVVANVRDVTEQKSAAQSQLHSQKLESLGMLAGGVAHDFNNLLVAMLSQTSLAKAMLEPNDRALVHIEKATMAASRAADLTRQLLAYSGKASLVMNPIRLDTLIEESLHLFAVGIHKQISLQFRTAADLPNTTGDRGQIQQIFMNLILNAAEAIGERPGEIKIVLEVMGLTPADEKYWQLTKDPLLPGDYVRVVIQDNGAGIDSEMLQNIFDPFFTTKFTGRGLGLAAVLGIVRGHHGGLRVSSEVGEGTTFELIFPVSYTEIPAQITLAPAPIPTQEQAATVLVVDDEASVRDAVVDILAMAEIETLTASDGRSAIKLYAQQGAVIDLVLLDLSMPGLSGQETYQALCEIDPNVKVLLSSGYSETEIYRQFSNSNSFDFLPKPYDMDTLVAKVREQLT